MRGASPRMTSSPSRLSYRLWGLTRASIHFRKKMDCRVKPGNDRDRFNLKKNALELQPRGSGKIDVRDDLLRDQGIELLRGKRHRFDPLWGELCLYGGERQRFLHLGVQSFDDGSRGLRRHQHPVPEAVIGVGIAKLDRGRHVRQGG